MPCSCAPFCAADDQSPVRSPVYATIEEVSAWACSVCGAERPDGEAARRCRVCHSIVCAGCTPEGKDGACVNCVIEEGERWFTPAAEEPIGRLPRRIPLALIALVVMGPILL